MVGLVALELLRARIALALVSEKRALELAGFGEFGTGSLPVRADARDWLEILRWAVMGVAPRLPFRSDCLVRSIAVRRILRCRGYDYRVNVEAGRLQDGRFEAHVWLESAGVRLTGGPNRFLSRVNATRGADAS